MSVVLIVRHGLTSSTGKALTGWLPGVDLDDRGRAQAAAVAARLARVPLAAIVSSPLERCVQTAKIIAAGHGDAAGEHQAPADGHPADGHQAAGAATGNGQVTSGAGPGGDPIEAQLDDRLGECRYGDWTGQRLDDLVKDPLWPVVQAHPSAVRFPGSAGDGLRGLLAALERAGDDRRERNRRQPGGERLGLLPAPFVEADAGRPARQHVPRASRQAMADKQNCCHAS